MDNRIYLKEIFEELEESDEFKYFIKESKLTALEKEKIKKAVSDKANELNSIGEFIPKEAWENIYIDALYIFSSDYYDQYGNIKRRQRHYEYTCVAIAFKDHSPVEVGSMSKYDNGDMDDSFGMRM